MHQWEFQLSHPQLSELVIKLINVIRNNKIKTTAAKYFDKQ